MPYQSALTAALLACVLTPLSAQEPSSDGDESLFGLSSVTAVEIRISGPEWKKLQPPADTNWDVGRALEGVVADAIQGKNFKSDQSSRPGLAGYAGIDHQYGKANVVLGDQTVADVGVRYKGNGTFISGFPVGKCSFKLDFNEYNEAGEFRGLTKVNLNNNISDPSFLREALSYELFREAGIAAPRVGWARVRVIVDEEEPQQLGLYSIVEQVDKRFLKRNYGSSKGLLLKPSTFGIFRYFGVDWNQYEAAYNPKTSASPEQQQRLIAFAKFVQHASDDEFAEGSQSFLDMDQFYTFLSMNVLLSNMDSFLGGSQNYYAYLSPESNLFELLPWDLDHSFGAFPLLGTPESRRNLSIDEPGTTDSNNPLITRVLANDRFRLAYHTRLEQLLGTVFAEPKLKSQMDDVGKFVRTLIDEDSYDRFDVALGETPTEWQPHVLKYFVEKRTQSVSDQLAGRSAGQTHGFDDPTPWGAVIAAIVVALAINLLAWIFGLIAGAKASTGWGVANAVVYPFAPMWFGFVARRDVGLKCAITVTLAIGFLLIVLFGSAIALSL